MNLAASLIDAYVKAQLELEGGLSGGGAVNLRAAVGPSKKAKPKKWPMEITRVDDPVERVTGLEAKRAKRQSVVPTGSDMITTTGAGYYTKTLEDSGDALMGRLGPIDSGSQRSHTTGNPDAQFIKATLKAPKSKEPHNRRAADNMRKRAGNEKKPAKAQKPQDDPNSDWRAHLKSAYSAGKDLGDKWMTQAAQELGLLAPSEIEPHPNVSPYR